MDIINNTTHKLGDDLQTSLKRGDRLKVAASQIRRAHRLSKVTDALHALDTDVDALDAAGRAELPRREVWTSRVTSWRWAQ